MADYEFLINEPKYKMPCEKFKSNGTITDDGQHRQYRKTSNISRTLVSSKIVDNSDVVGASPVGAAPTTSPFST